MYRALYTLSVYGYKLVIRLASPFNTKAKDWVNGRKKWSVKLKDAIQNEEKVIWVHAASLGEIEMAIPILERLRIERPTYKILVTFFSPSGYHHFNPKNLADWVFYMPSDTKANAVRFLEIVKPSMALFVKYEIWPNFITTLQQKKIPIVLAPAYFSKDFFYFKKLHRNFFKSIFQRINTVLVQDEESKKVLEENNFGKAEVCGDSRIDRVKQNVKTDWEGKALESFVGESFVLIGGSTWEPGEEILKRALYTFPNVKLIIAPHDIRPANVSRIERLFGVGNCFKYSNVPSNPENYKVAIIDTIGLLSRLYRLGNAAYIGGAFGKGIHNSLEAAAYGLPVFFGPKHDGFVEPKEMMEAGFAFEIDKGDGLLSVLGKLIKEKSFQEDLQAKARQFLESKKGASDIIVKACLEYLPKG